MTSLTKWFTWKQRSWDALDVAIILFISHVSKKATKSQLLNGVIHEKLYCPLCFYVNWVPSCLNSCRLWILPPHSSVTSSICWYLWSYCKEVTYVITRFLIKHFLLELLGLVAPRTERLHHAICYVTTLDWHEEKAAHGNLTKEIEDYGKLKNVYDNCKFEKCAEYCPKRFCPGHDKNCPKIFMILGHNRDTYKLTKHSVYLGYSFKHAHSRLNHVKSWKSCEKVKKIKQNKVSLDLLGYYPNTLSTVPLCCSSPKPG